MDGQTTTEMSPSLETHAVDANVWRQTDPNRSTLDYWYVSWLQHPLLVSSHVFVVVRVQISTVDSYDRGERQPAAAFRYSRRFWLARIWLASSEKQHIISSITVIAQLLLNFLDNMEFDMIFGDLS